MPDLTKGVMLADLSWPEVAEIKNDVDLVLLPVGSNEQHGSNLSLKMDIAASAEFCRRASASMQPRVMVAPAVPWGVSFHHMNFPGTITLSPETFIQILVEVVQSLQHHGFNRFLIVNGHGGNVAPMNVALLRVQEELEVDFIGACSYFSFADPEIQKKYVTSEVTGHACEFETSAAMELVPDVVKHDTLAAGEMTELTQGFRKLMQKYSVGVPYRFDEFTRNGSLGDATKASPEFGKELISSALSNFVEFCDELIKAH